MSGRRPANNILRKVTTSAKSIKIVTTNTKPSNKNFEDLDIQHENLDYEAEDIQTQNIGYGGDKSSIAEDFNDICVASSNRPSSSASRTLRLSSDDSINISKDLNISSDIEEIMSSVSSHRSEMIPYNKHLDMAQDGRQNDYFNFIPKTCPTVLLDSSSSSGYSGTSHQDDVDEDEDMIFSEEYELTNEEENKLLKSDDEISSIEDEVSQEVTKKSDEQIIDRNPVFQNNKVVMNGLNIIIKASNFNFHKPFHRKWELRYKPYPPVTLFLEDVGFIPPEKTELENSESASVGSVIPMTSFKVTLGSNQERMCEQVQKAIQCKNEFGFKMPLPPAKRPPTRPKRSGASTPSSSISDATENHLRERFLSQRSSIILPKEDDAISIVASTIGLDQFDQDLNEKEEIRSEVMSENRTSITQFEEPFSNQSNVERWLNTINELTAPPVTKDPNLRIVLNTGSVENRSVMNVPFVRSPSEKEQASNSPNPGPSSNSPLIFKDIHPVFNGICYFHFFHENCVKFECRMPHVIKESNFLKRCKDLINNSEEMQKVYNFSLRFHRLFKEIYSCLLKGFANHQMQKSIISSVEDFFALKEIVNPNTAISQIISALNDTGLDFTAAIEKISFNIGFLRYPELADILLDLITLRRDQITANWDLITRICRARNHIDPKIFERIVSQMLTTTPIDKDRCKEIYKIGIDMTDLTKVNQEWLTPISTLCQFGYSLSVDKNLTMQRKIFESQEQNETFHAGDSLSSASSRRSNSSAGRSSDIDEVMSSSRGNYLYVPQAVNIPAIIPQPSVPNPIPLIIDTSVPPPFYPALSKEKLSLCPSMPIFGKFRYRKEFAFVTSLHNLLPTSRDQVAMNEMDIIKLNDVIVNKNGAGFLDLLNQYKSPETLQHFITMSIAHLKNCKRMCYNNLILLLENVETVFAEFRSDPLLKGVFEVIVFNLLFYFERNCQWQEARNAIETFCDWDSLVSSKQFALNQLSPIGRYLFLARLLAKSRAFYKVYEIIRCPDLHLLESPNKWPLFGCPQTDIENRNLLLTDFFENSYRCNHIEVCCDMYRNIFQFGEIWEFDAHTFFNPMLEYLINNEKISLLKHFYNNIDIFHSKMDKHIYRAFVILIAGQVNLQNRFKLYELGCRKGLYFCFTGREPFLVVRTNMPDSEIMLILQYYMNKLHATHRTQPVNHNLKIEIRLPDCLAANSPKILQKCMRSICEVNQTVHKLLFECFGINLNDSSQEGKSTVVEVPREMLVGGRVVRKDQSFVR